MNRLRTHRATNTRSCSTENAKRQCLSLQLWFAIVVQENLSPSDWKARRSTYPYPGLSNRLDFVTIRKSSRILLVESNLHLNGQAILNLTWLELFVSTSLQADSHFSRA